MHEIAKHEFLSWVDTLETEQLSEHEITMLSKDINRMSLFVKISEIKSKYHDFINILRMNGFQIKANELE